MFFVVFSAAGFFWKENISPRCAAITRRFEELISEFVRDYVGGYFGEVWKEIERQGERLGMDCFSWNSVPRYRVGPCSGAVIAVLGYAMYFV